MRVRLLAKTWRQRDQGEEIKDHDVFVTLRGGYQLAIRLGWIEITMSIKDWKGLSQTVNSLIEPTTSPSRLIPPEPPKPTPGELANARIDQLQGYLAEHFGGEAFHTGRSLTFSREDLVREHKKIFTHLDIMAKDQLEEKVRDG